MKRGLFVLTVVTVLSLSSPATATPIGVLQQISPVAKTYLLGAGLDFIPFLFSGLGDVTALIGVVDVTIPPTPVTSSTSGCEAADFAGFQAGRIALIQRGLCPFTLKVQNAAAAGAIGALIFNEGQVGRTEVFEVADGAPATIPAAFTSFAVGLELYNASLTGGAIVRLQVTDVSPTVPEPATLTLLGLGLAGAVVGRRRRR